MATWTDYDNGHDTEQALAQLTGTAVATLAEPVAVLLPPRPGVLAPPCLGCAAAAFTPCLDLGGSEGFCLVRWEHAARLGLVDAEVLAEVRRLAASALSGIVVVTHGALAPLRRSR